MSSAESAKYLGALPDSLLALAVSHASVASIGNAASSCRRLRRLAVTSLLLHEHHKRRHHHKWSEAPSARAVGPQNNSALAITRDTIASAVNDDLILTPLQSAPASPPELTLREAAQIAQASCAEVALAVHRRADDAKRGLVAVALRTEKGHARCTKVRCATTTGRSLKSLRVGGALSALAVSDGLVATARRGCGTVQLWHAESGALAAQLSAHAEAITIRALVMRGRGLLLSAATDGIAAMHTTRAASAACAARLADIAADDGGGVDAGGAEPMVVDADSAARPVDSCLCRGAGHRAAAVCVELYAGWLLSGGDDGRVLVHAASGGRLVRALNGHTTPIVALVGVDAHVLSVARDGGLSMWSVDDGVRLRTLSLLGPPPASSPSRPAVHALALERVADTDTLPTSSPPLALVRACAHDGTMLCLRSDGKVSLWAWPPATARTSVAAYAPLLPSTASTASEGGGSSDEVQPTSLACATGGLLSGGGTYGSLEETAAAAAISATMAAVASPPAREAPAATASSSAPGVVLSPERFGAARVAQRIARAAPSVEADVPEFMAAVLEVVASQMLQRAGDAAVAGSSGRIEPHHLRSAVRGDENLAKLVGSSALEQGGLLRPDDEE